MGWNILNTLSNGLKANPWCIQKMNSYDSEQYLEGLEKDTKDNLAPQSKEETQTKEYNYWPESLSHLSQESG